MKLLTQITFLLLFSFGLFGQDNLFEKADAFVNTGKFDKAITWLKKEYKKTGNPNFALKISDLYFNENDIEMAFTWADEVHISESDSLPYVLRYVELLMGSGKYREALDRCLSYAVNDLSSDEIKKKAYTCEKLIHAQQQSILFRLEEVPFNLSSDEISITNYRRQLVMSSNRNSENADSETENSNFEVFMIERNYDQWRYPYYLLKERNGSQNITSLNYSMDGNFVYYTISNVLTAKQQKKNPDITPEFKMMEGISMGNKWEKTQPLPHQMEGYNYKDPTLHPNGHLLVFSSNRNGDNQYDLYSMTKVNGEWTTPVSLGNRINSAGDEIMPYFREDGRLYFSSNQPSGFGGFDIYNTRMEGGKWLAPAILPPPINSTFDDLSYTHNYDHTGGYFTSNRPGGQGGFDVYAFEEEAYQLGVTVINKASGALIEFAEVALISKGVILEERMTNSKGLAEFTIGKEQPYVISVNKDHFKTTKQDYEAKKSDDNHIVYTNIKLLPETNNEETTSAYPQNNQDYIKVTVSLKNSDKTPLSNMEVRLINTKNNRMKILQTSTDGTILQSLYFGNKYRLIFDFDGEKHEYQFDTEEMHGKSSETLTFTINGD